MAGRAPDADGTLWDNDARRGQQRIARGPVASQIAIKMLSSAAGFSTSVPAHPFETPPRRQTPVEMVPIFAIGAG
jgi:K+-transporting ATPase ATPase A chain